MNINRFGKRNVAIWNARERQFLDTRNMQWFISGREQRLTSMPPRNTYRQPIAEGDHTLPPWHPHYDGRAQHD